MVWDLICVLPFWWKVYFEVPMLLFCYQMPELKHVLFKRKKKKKELEPKQGSRWEVRNVMQLWWLPKYLIILREQESNCRSGLRKDVVGLLCWQAVWAWGTENEGQGASVTGGSSKKRQSCSGAGAWPGTVAGGTGCFSWWRGGLGLRGSCWSGGADPGNNDLLAAELWSYNRHTFTFTSSDF